VLERITAMARDEATSPESRPENKYDTRALEASYLAAGQGPRLAELRQLVAWAALEPSSCAVGQLGALVHVEVDDVPRWVLLGPRGGPSASCEGGEVGLVSVESPLGRALQGLAAGDDGELDRPSGVVGLEVLSVS
jgi:transcription elongation GreA/GreB family factor